MDNLHELLFIRVVIPAGFTKQTPSFLVIMTNLGKQRQEMINFKNLPATVLYLAVTAKENLFNMQKEVYERYEVTSYFIERIFLLCIAAKLVNSGY